MCYLALTNPLLMFPGFINGTIIHPNSVCNIEAILDAFLSSHYA